MRGLELIEQRHDDGTIIAVIRDRPAGTVSAVVRVSGHGFPLSSAGEQDVMLSGWAAALSPFAREQSAVATVTWQEWAHPVTSAAHADFLRSVGVHQRATDTATADYLDLIEHQAPVTVAHEVLVTVTIALRKVRARRTSRSRLHAAIDVLVDELRLFSGRLDAAGLSVDEPLDAVALSAAIRVRSDPSKGPQVATLTRSLAAAARRGAIEWGPMVLDPEWAHARVDGMFHRSYRVAGWPLLPVGSDWLSELLTGTQATRTITVVLEPVPMGKAARAADREVMSRESDADMKTQKGFRSTLANANDSPTSKPANASCPRDMPSSSSSGWSTLPPRRSMRSTMTVPTSSRPPHSRCSTYDHSTPATSWAGSPRSPWDDHWSGASNEPSRFPPIGRSTAVGQPARDTESSRAAG